MSVHARACARNTHMHTCSPSSHYKVLQGVSVSLAVGVAMAFVPATFVVFVVQERANSSKHLQVLSGE